MILTFFMAMASPLIPENTGQESYSETYTAFVDLQDETYVLMQFLFTNAGFGSNKAGCRLLFVPKGAKGYNSSVQLGSGDWKASASILKVGKCHLKDKNGNTEMYVQTDDGHVRLDISAGIKKKTLPDGVITVGSNDFYEQDLLIPNAVAKVEYSVKGQKGNAVGFVQLDHTRSNTILPKIAKGWYRYRGFDGETPILAQVRSTPKGKQIGWVYDPSAKKVSTLLSATLNTESVLNTDNGALRVQPSKMIYEYRPLESYGIMGSVAKAFVGNPVTRTYHAVATWKGSQSSGILEWVQID